MRDGYKKAECCFHCEESLNELDCGRINSYCGNFREEK
jgi:hypothetical protein